MSDNLLKSSYDCIVVGGGHAGIEAALITARMGLSSLLVSIKADAIGAMSCNPAIGGLAKGHMVREIDALGGEMGKAIDATGIQFKMLNTSKGPAVWAPRAQADKEAYATYMQEVIAQQKDLDLLEDTVEEILVEKSTIKGIKSKSGHEILTKSLIITTGTFLKGLMHTGEEKTSGGRYGEAPAVTLSDSLKSLGFNLGRLKTGTPPRLDKNSIDFSNFRPQEENDFPFAFSHFTHEIPESKVQCYIAHTNSTVQKIIKENIHRAPMYSGQIQSLGPRYCPSIEDKVVRFADKESHQLFLEPETLHGNSIYVNGLSTSLPKDVQEKVVHSIQGLEKAEFLRYGYAVEYDFVFPHQIYPTYETKIIKGLYLAGQINGTSGYEEAGGQGILAGINAALKLQGKDPFVMDRSESYLAVMTDDLVSKDIFEPYRMFTSRAEHRLVLRWDNADKRLFHYARSFGLIDATEYQHFLKRLDRIEEGIQTSRNYRLKKEKQKEVEAFLDRALKGGESIAHLLKMNLKSIFELKPFFEELQGYTAEELRQIEIECRYEGYIQHENDFISKLKKMEKIKIPEDFDYDTVTGLLTEAREKLKKFRPMSLGQAARITGVNPSDISILMVFLKRRDVKVA